MSGFEGHASQLPESSNVFVRHVLQKMEDSEFTKLFLQVPSLLQFSHGKQAATSHLVGSQKCELTEFSGQYLSVENEQKVVGLSQIACTPSGGMGLTLVSHKVMYRRLVKFANNSGIGPTTRLL